MSAASNQKKGKSTMGQEDTDNSGLSQDYSAVSEGYNDSSADPAVQGSSDPVQHTDGYGTTDPSELGTGDDNSGWTAAGDHSTLGGAVGAVAGASAGLGGGPLGAVAGGVVGYEVGSWAGESPDHLHTLGTGSEIVGTGVSMIPEGGPFVGGPIAISGIAENWAANEWEKANKEAGVPDQ
jgi:hypothetical protein